MKNKILITGGAGFIGSELVKLIKNKKNIIVVDKKKNKKVIDKYNLLGIKYIKGNLLNKSFSKKVYKNAKIIYHLAGIVKVPNTDVNLDYKKEKIIFNEAVTILNNLLTYCEKNIKVIFPSTHLVFENCKKNKQIFYENSKPLPNLAYSRSKYECEKLLKNKKVNYSILRLGSVYGETQDEKRMFNLPNLFPLKTKKNQDLKLFSNGIQIKSIVSVKDVARAMTHVDKKNIKNQIFHLVSEHLTVKQIGIICKKYNNKINLIKTKDKIPYEGYFMNSNKINKHNFKYKYKYKSFAKKYILGF